MQSSLRNNAQKYPTNSAISREDQLANLAPEAPDPSTAWQPEGPDPIKWWDKKRQQKLRQGWEKIFFNKKNRKAFISLRMAQILENHQWYNVASL